MRKFPEDTDDKKDLDELNCAPWMVDLLKLNPEYVFWGPHEDYMCDTKSQWGSRIIKESWVDFGPWGLDELNECVNFYFELARENKQCETCQGSGYHPDAQWIAESFYKHSSPFVKHSAMEIAQGDALAAKFGLISSGHDLRRAAIPNALVVKYGAAFAEFVDQMMNTDGQWADKITADEADVLAEHHRNYNFKELAGQALADAMNAREKNGGLGHDGINRLYLIEQRCKRLGVPVRCEPCNGSGHIWTADDGHVNLVLWWLHPRKGCSRGIEVKHIQEHEVPEILGYLTKAARRNAERFGAVVNALGKGGCLKNESR